MDESDAEPTQGYELFRDEQLTILPTRALTPEAAYILCNSAEYETRQAGFLGFKRGPKTVVLRAPVYLDCGRGVMQSLSGDVILYRSDDSARIDKVLAALKAAPAAQRAEEKVEREAKDRAREAARRAEEDHYESLLQRAAAKETMPFAAWAAAQPDGELLITTAEQFSVRLDHAYGGPNIVDRFFERGLPHIVRDDIWSTSRRVPVWLDLTTLAKARTEARKRIQQSNEDLIRSVIDDMDALLVRQRRYARQLRLDRLCGQYEVLMIRFATER